MKDSLFNRLSPVVVLIVMGILLAVIVYTEYYRPDPPERRYVYASEQECLLESGQDCEVKVCDVSSSDPLMHEICSGIPNEGWVPKIDRR